MFANLSEDLEQFLAEEVASGRFPNREAVISHALRMLQDDRMDAIAGIEAGQRDFELGRVQPLDEAFADLRQELGIESDD